MFGLALLVGSSVTLGWFAGTIHGNKEYEKIEKDGISFWTEVAKEVQKQNGH